MVDDIVFVGQILDNVHGFIPYTDAEEKIIESLYFKRLQSIKQLSVVNWVFPGSEHTRFIHSLGVMHIADKISYKYEVGSSDYFTVLLSQSDIRIYVDVEDADIESLDKNGITGYFFEKDNLKYVCFDCDGCSFAVYGSLEEDELIKIAAGIAKE